MTTLKKYRNEIFVKEISKNANLNRTNQKNDTSEKEKSEK